MSCLGQVYGNASSIHHFGQAAKQRLEAARRQVAALIHADAARDRVHQRRHRGGQHGDPRRGARPPTRPRQHVITSAIEHPAVLTTVQATRARRRGRDAPCAVGRERHRESRRRPPRAAAGDRAGLHHARQQRTGHRAADRRDRADRAARRACRCTWTACRRWARSRWTWTRWAWTSTRMSGHKLYAPKGVGALYVRKGTRLAPITFGGHHERDRRPGTENVPGIAAFGAAAELAGARLAGGRRAPRAAARPPGERRPGPHSRHRHQRLALESHAQHQQHLLRRHRRRGPGDRARPARLRGFHRRGLLERRARAVARAHGHRPDATTARAPACAFRWAAPTPPSRWTRWWRPSAASVAHLRRISVHA